MYQSKQQSNRHKSQSMQVLAALGVLCFSQGNGSALQSKHTSGQVSGMTTSSQSYLAEGIGASSSMMTSEMNRIAADVENMVEQNTELNADLVDKLAANEQESASQGTESQTNKSKKKRHHRRRHNHNKNSHDGKSAAQKSSGDRPSNGKNVGLKESRTMDEEQEATQKTMDMVREELEHSIDTEGEEKEDDPRQQARNPQLAHFSKQSAMMAAQNAEEDRDLDDPDFKKKDQDEAESEAKEEPGQMAAEKILKAQQVAAQREREEEKLEQEAQARAHQLMMRQGNAFSSSFGSSASQLAHQLSSSIEEKPYEPAAASRLAPIPAPAPKRSLMAPVQTEKTANLIAQAILHQQQQAAGVEDEAPAPESSFSAPSMSDTLANAARETRMSATQTKEAAPLVPLGSQVKEMAPSATGSAFASPLVTKDELIEGSKMSLSAQDQAAKDHAVQETLNKLKGIKTQQPTLPSSLQPSLQPSFYASQPSPALSSFGAVASTPAPFVSSPPSSAASSTAQDNAVSRTLELIKKSQSGAQSTAEQGALPPLPTPFLPGPSPQAAPVQSNPIQKAQKPQKKAKAADSDDDVEAPEKEKPAEKPEKKLSQKEEEQAEFDYMNDVEARQRKLVEKHQKARQQEEDGTADDAPEQKPAKVEKHATSTAEVSAEPKVAPAAMTQAPQPAPAAPSPAQSAQSEVVRATLERIKNSNNQQQQELATPQPSIMAPSPAANEKDAAVQKTLEIIRKTQQEQQKQNLSPTPFVDAPPAPEPKQASTSSPEIEAQQQKVEALQEQVRLEEQAKKDEAQKSMIQKAIEAVKLEKQKAQSAPEAPKPAVKADVAATAPVPFLTPQSASQAPAKKPAAAKATPAKTTQAKAVPKPAPAPAPAPAPTPAQKQKQDDDEVAGYKITVDKLDFDEPGIKHDQPGGNPAEREKQEMAETAAQTQEQKKRLGTQSMQQKKNSDGSTTFSIETSGLDADEDASDASRSAMAFSNQSNKKSGAASTPGKKQEDGKLKQIKKDDSLDFKIETTVATPDLIKHLVGDNTPDEEEESLAKAQPQKQAVKPAAKPILQKKAPTTQKPIHIQQKQNIVAVPKKYVNNAKTQMIKPVKKMVPQPPTQFVAKSQPSKIIKPIPIQPNKPVIKPLARPAAVVKNAAKPAPTTTPTVADKSNDLFSQGIAAAINELEQASRTDPVPFVQPSASESNNQVSTPMFTVASKDKDPKPAQQSAPPASTQPDQTDLKDLQKLTELLAKASNTTMTTSTQADKSAIDMQKNKEISGTQKKEETSKPMDMRAQIQSIVASIQPALQRAIGSSNTAKIQVIITDKEDDKKKDEEKAEKKFQKDLTSAFGATASKSSAANGNSTKPLNTVQTKDKNSKNSTVTGSVAKNQTAAKNQTMAPAINNVTINAKSQSQVQQIVDAIKNNQQQAHLNVTVTAVDSAANAGHGIVDTTSKYIDAQNKLNAQTTALKQKKEEDDAAAKLATAMQQIEKQMDAEQKKQEEIKNTAIQHAIQAAKEKEESERKAREQLQLEQAAAMQQKLEEEQKRKDEIVQKHIQLAKQQKVAQTKDAVQKTLDAAKVAQAQQQQVQQKQAISQASPYQKAIESSLKKAKEQQKTSRTGGALSNLAASLESTIVEDQPTPFVSQPQVSAPSAAIPQDNSLRSQIIRNSIEKGKQLEAQKTHPLSGGLFDHLQDFKATVGPVAPAPATAMPTTFQAPYLMVQKANSTAALLQQDKDAVKNATKGVEKNSTVVAAKNSTKEQAVNATSLKNATTATVVAKTVQATQTVASKAANQTTAQQKNQTLAAVKNNQTANAQKTVNVTKNTTSSAAKAVPKAGNQTFKSAVKVESNKTAAPVKPSLATTIKESKDKQNKTVSAKQNTTATQNVSSSKPAQLNASKTAQPKESLTQRGHSSKWAIDWNAKDESAFNAKDAEPASQPAKAQSIAEPVHAATNSEVDALVKQADSNRADWEKKKTAEIRHEEEQRALIKTNQALKEENEALQQHQKQLKEETEKREKEAEAKKKEAEAKEAEAKQREENEKREKEESERKRKEEAERKIKEEAERKEYEEKVRKEKEEERIVAEKAKEQVKKDFAEHQKQEEKRAYEESQKRFEQSHKEAEEKRRKEDEAEDQKNAALKLKDNFSKGKSNAYKKYEKNDKEDAPYKALKKINSFSDDVRQELSRQEQLKDAVKKEYLKGLADGASSSKSESKEETGSKFEMLPSEKSKLDKKQKRKEEKALQASVAKEAVKIVAREEAAKDKILYGTLAQKSQIAKTTNITLEPKALNTSRTAAQVTQQQAANTTQAAQQASNTSHVQVKAVAPKPQDKNQTAKVTIVKNQTNKVEVNKTKDAAAVSTKNVKTNETKAKDGKKDALKMVQLHTQNSQSKESNTSQKATPVKPTQALNKKLKQQDASGLSSEEHSAPISHTFAVHQQEMNYGEASDAVVEVPTTTSDILQARVKQSLAALQSKEQINEREAGKQQGGMSSQAQTQVLNMATVESKGTSINQHRAAVKSTSNLILDDLKLLDTEAKESKPEPKKTEAPTPKKEEPKKEQMAPQAHKDEAESWFTASVHKFRSLKQRMFSALSLLPQTASASNEAPENFENIQLTNQQKLGLFDTIVNDEDDADITITKI